MPETQSVEQLISRAFVQVKADATVGEALKALQDAQAQYIVVASTQNNPLSVIGVQQLRAANANEAVGTFVQHMPALVLEPNVPISSAARALAKDLVLKPQLAGVLVQAQGRAEGILPRKTIVDYAARNVTRGTSDRLEGSPLDVLIYECPVDHERQIITYYDPAHPPMCSQGHLMQPIED